MTVNKSSISPKKKSVSRLRSKEKYALISVSDKTEIVEFAKIIKKLGFKIISTGGTAAVLKDAGILTVPIQDVTGNPESFDGRMKTISFQVEGGILYDRKNPNHIKEAKDLGIKPIDIVVANLYPFEKTVSRKGVSLDEAIENIDVGGPTMVRSAAKNNKNVLVITDPLDYKRVGMALLKGKVNQVLRLELAAKAFAHLSFYDAQIAKFLSRSGEKFPPELTAPGRLGLNLRYGENPHQSAAVYFEPGTSSPMKRLNLISGRELSLTNFLDINAGIEVARIFTDEPCGVVIKHNSPCGIALGKSASEALIRAIKADPKSAFGGVVVLNRAIDLETAKTFAAFKEEDGVQMDIIAAPSVTERAVEFIKGVRKTTGIYTFGEIYQNRTGLQVKAFDGGFVLQDWDDEMKGSFSNWKISTKTKPSKDQKKAMQFAWKIIGRIKSNTIIVVDSKIPMTRGIGSGQTSRVGSTEIALAQAGEYAVGGILASDSFFPFDDSVKLAAKAGIGAIIQQGGSRNDDASIKAADEFKIPMVHTGERKFWH